MTVMKFRPFQVSKNRPFGSVWDDVNLFFDDFNLTSLSEKTAFVPTLDIKENQKSYTVTAELAGLEEKDIDLTFKDGVLTLKGERKIEDKKEDENYVRVERFYGSFHRSVTIGQNIDEKNVKAQFKNGLLTITLPKQENQIQAHKIKIQS